MKRVLVTGVSGFIGRHSLPFLLQREFEVHGIIPLNEIQLDIQGVHWHAANLLDLEQISTLVEKINPSHLLHLAWHTAPGVYWNSLENIRWLQASIELLRSFKASGGQRIVVAGTCAEYDWRFGYCTEQITPLKPDALYGVCKNALHDILISFAKQEDLSAAWGRIFFLYGPYEYRSRLVSSVINALLEKKPAPCTHGEQIRDFLYVEDVASAFVSLLDSEIEGAVNIASGKPITLKEIVFQIGELIGKSDLIQLGAIPVSKDEPPFLVADVKRLQKELDWFPNYSMNSGLVKTIEWWKQQKK